LKIGISYSLFDCEELLQRSVEVLRDCGVEHVSVLWQKVSFFGQPASEGIEDLLNDLVRKRLIDELRLYTPKYSGKPVCSLYTTKFAKMDETVKRNLGLEIARKAGCTHFLSVDADEFYFPKEFRNASTLVEENDIDYSVVSIQPYHLRPTYALHAFNDSLKVPFLINVKKWPDTWFEFSSLAFGDNCNTDPTRRISMNPRSQKLHVFPEDQIMMHHMRTVRKNLCKKYINSTHFQSANPRRVRRMLQQAREMRGVFEGNILEVENHFNIHIETDASLSYEPPYLNWKTPLLWGTNFIVSKLFRPLDRTVYR
jgi:hypothetical protein